MPGGLGIRSTPEPGDGDRLQRPKTALPDPVRRVRLSGGRVVDVRGTGHYTLYRHVGDTTSPYAGCWMLASPEFRAELERAVVSGRTSRTSG